jgi:hypothetical protein
VAAMSQAQENDGILCFLYLLVLLLVMMLVAAIRQPESAYHPPDSGDQPGEAAATTAAGTPGQARRASGQVASGPVGEPVSLGSWGASAGVGPAAGLHGGAARRSSKAKYVARHVAGPEPGRGTIRMPKVAGRPPWGPAPRPPDQRGLTASHGQAVLAGQN